MNDYADKAYLRLRLTVRERMREAARDADRLIPWTILTVWAILKAWSVI